MMAVIATGCKREIQNPHPLPAEVVVFGNAARQSELQPGGVPAGAEPAATSSAEGIAVSIAEGQRLFSTYNCSGCHANGGGGMGPPLIKQQWTYGNQPQNLFDTIVKGRPNGMPAWGARVPAYQVWQLAAYIRSLNGLEPKDATMERADTIEQNGSNALRTTPAGDRIK